MKAHWIMSGAPPEGFQWTGDGPVAAGAADAPLRVEGAVRADAPLRVEAVVGVPNFKAIWWLESALKAARSVARVKLPTGSATGFLIAKDIFMTNNHVFENEQDAGNASLQFNYRLTADGELAGRDPWECDPDDLFKTHKELDYTIVRVKPKDGKTAGDTWGRLDLRNGASVRVNQRANIIQHPQGRFQEIAFRDNQVKDIKENYIQYRTDTDYGTSGAPVFDDWFNIIALHNLRVQDPTDPARWHRNQGSRVTAILKDAGNLIPQ